MPDDSIVLTLRLSPDDVEYLDEAARTLCNTRAGVIRFAIKKLRDVVEVQEGPVQPEQKTELAKAS